MPFIKKKKNVYPWPVEIQKPSEENPGHFENYKFIAKFARLPKKELDNFSNMKEDEILAKIIVGWDEVEDEDGKPLLFSKIALKEFGEDTDFTTGILKAYEEFYGKTVEKN